jgi:predicted RNA-binding Zn ribbon-like protein
VSRARQTLAEEGIAIGHLTEDDLPLLVRLADAVSELGDCLALRRQPRTGAVEVINEQASACTGTIRAKVRGRAVHGDVDWRDPDPVAGLARRVIGELAGSDLSRFHQCQRRECDLLFFDTTKSRSQRWHAENPCGWLERQHRRRGRERHP